MLFAGIDPGLNGAMALIDEDAKLIDLIDMPTLAVTKTRRQLDRHTLVGVLEDWRALQGEFSATIERVMVMPGQGSSSGLKLGTGYGILLGILAAQKIPTDDPPPQRWQKAIIGQIAPGTAKDRVRAFVQDRYPSADLGKKRSQDRSDAVCIALYGRQYWRGEG